MQNMMQIISRVWMLCFCVIILTGCDGTNKTATTGDWVFYPEAPAPPRLQYLTTFKSGKAFNTQKKTSFSEWVVGKTDADSSASDRFESPYGMAAFHGKLYICDVGSDRVHVVDLVNQTYGLLGTPTLIRNPVNVAIDEDGTKYICDSGRRKVLIFDANDKYVGEFGNPNDWVPLDIVISGNELFIADVVNGEIEVWSKQKEFLRKIGTKGRGPEELSNPTNLDIGPDDNLYITDTMQQIVKIFNKQGKFQGEIGKPGGSVGQFARPKGIAVDSHGMIFVADSQWDTVQVFNAKGELLMPFGDPGDKIYNFGLPAGLAIDKTSMPYFKQFLHPDFEAEYLLFVVNQFGKNKITVFAYGKDKTVDPKSYDINWQKIMARREQLKAEEKASDEEKEKTSDEEKSKPTESKR